ncbi:pantoate--beta-alanine ligase [Entomobacter blattae]|uniref:Pantothenate synthetase n=1 Tax=Entomobacter blattae TaxID=2762277 RepID=A0A7H1NQ08_9PROT|nr:pantoate--beta-alanine ligase [Entomobacter blattae]QNT77868.1 Pantothenate synthetase [Entomobacter blattae]
MEVLRNLADLEDYRHHIGLKKSEMLTLVPTMGSLHAGHLSLVQRAKEPSPEQPEALPAKVMVSIFVNPIQFDQPEDLKRYPRQEEYDIALLSEAGCDAVWIPDVKAMYPKGFATRIEVEGPALLWEGARRPGHFSGVATVVARLFGLITPDRAIFGEKDWQQLQVIKRMVADLSLGIIIEGAPIVREEDGLALSSRNQFLTPTERAQAPILYKTLLQVREKLQNKAPHSVLQEARQTLTEKGFSVDYLEIVQKEEMLVAKAWSEHTRLITAARLGSVRLLDNIGP